MQKILNPWLWLDGETTGLDPRLDQIMAIGFILTDSNLREYARGEYVIGMTPAMRSRLDAAPAIVREMHTRNGLIVRCHASELTLLDVVGDMVSKIDALIGDKNPATLAGNTVHFDRAFLREHTGDALLRYVGHRHLDVSTFKVLATAWDLPLFPKSDAMNRQHTPLADLEHSLAEFKHWREVMFRDSAIPFEIRKADGRPYIDSPPPRSRVNDWPCTNRVPSEPCEDSRCPQHGK